MPPCSPSTDQTPDVQGHCPPSIHWTIGPCQPLDTCILRSLGSPSSGSQGTGKVVSRSRDPRAVGLAEAPPPPGEWAGPGGQSGLGAWPPSCVHRLCPLASCMALQPVTQTPAARDNELPGPGRATDLCRQDGHPPWCVCKGQGRDRDLKGTERVGGCYRKINPPPFFYRFTDVKCITKLGQLQNSN